MVREHRASYSAIDLPGRGNSFAFFFIVSLTTEIYTLSLHDALPISAAPAPPAARWVSQRAPHPNAAKVFINWFRSEEHTSELQSHSDLVCRLLLEKKNIIYNGNH